MGLLSSPKHEDKAHMAKGKSPIRLLDHGQDSPEKHPKKTLHDEGVLPTWYSADWPKILIGPEAKGASFGNASSHDEICGIVLLTEKVAVESEIPQWERKW